MTKALQGVRILDFTHVQSGPTCTQLLAWFGADVIKVERPGVGDITRGQLQDKPNVDSLYFTMLNHNKRSITLDTKNPKGKEVLTALIKKCDVLVENFGPGVLNLARVKLRDQQRLAHGPLTEYSQYGEGIPFGEAVPRAGNDSGGGQPGRILKCKGWETDPNAYIYFITQAPVWEKICDVIGEPGWKTHPAYAKPPARLSRLNEIFARIGPCALTNTTFPANALL